MEQYSMSGLIKDPKTNKVLKVAELYKGRKVEVTEQELANYDMRPQSGTIKDVNGNIISLVDLILASASNGGGGVVTWDSIVDKPTEFPPSAHTHDDKANILMSATKPQGYVGIWCKKVEV